MRGNRAIHFTGKHSIFDRLAGAITRAVGSSWAFIVAVAVIVAWALSGPVLDFSETWQLVINTGTTIVTFLMVFLIQQSQNKDSLAIHIKLNELLASHESASNRTIAVEELDEKELQMLRDFYCKLAELAQHEGGIKSTHSLDDANESHARKQRAGTRRINSRVAEDIPPDNRTHGQYGSSAKPKC